MKSRATSTAILSSVLIAALCAGPAYTQQPQPPKDNAVAKLKDMKGNVLVSQGDAMTAGANDQRLVVGTRVVTTAGARVIINYDVGCEVELKENQRFTVRSGECGALMGEVVALGAAEGAIGGGTATATAFAASGGLGGLGVAGTIAVAAGITALAIAGYDTFKSNPVSPN